MERGKNPPGKRSAKSKGKVIIQLNQKKTVHQFPRNLGVVSKFESPPLTEKGEAEKREKFVPEGKLLLPSRPLACSQYGALGT